MLKAFRHARVTPTLALAMQLCMAVLSVSGLLHADDDTICNPEVVLHNHDAHRIGAADGVSQAPDHCFICHNLSLRSLVSRTRVPAPAAVEQRVANTPRAAHDSDISPRRPARAPPAA